MFRPIDHSELEASFLNFLSFQHAHVGNLHNKKNTIYICIYYIHTRIFKYAPCMAYMNMHVHIYVDIRYTYMHTPIKYINKQIYVYTYTPYMVYVYTYSYMPYIHICIHVLK